MDKYIKSMLLREQKREREELKAKLKEVEKKIKRLEDTK